MISVVGTGRAVLIGAMRETMVSICRMNDTSQIQALV